MFSNPQGQTVQPCHDFVNVVKEIVTLDLTTQ